MATRASSEESPPVSRPRPLSRVERVAYLAQQQALRLQTVAAHQLARTATGQRDAPPPETLSLIRRRYDELLARDLANVEAGYYPRALLFQVPIARYVRRLPALLRDVPRTLRRATEEDYRDLPEGVDLRAYPPYYRRTFHWQTDGYLSRRSAKLYDLAVELLFLGTADVMRRQVIPPVARFVRGRDRAAPGPPMRLLDVACGTGRTLGQIGAALPELHLYGLDLSPYYVELASEELADLPRLTLVADNAERMPFGDGAFDVVTCVYLFHELPRNARRNVVREMARVVRPGGLVVIEDSAQPSESAGLAHVLGRFSREFHEPFYEDYLEDTLETLLAEAGLESCTVEAHFVSKVVIARRPDGRPR